MEFLSVYPHCGFWLPQPTHLLSVDEMLAYLRMPLFCYRSRDSIISLRYCVYVIFEYDVETYQVFSVRTCIKLL